MFQTLGAFFATLGLILFAINFQHSNLHTQRPVVQSEVDVLANEVAGEAMRLVAGKPFDAATIAGLVGPTNPDLSRLTDASAFGGTTSALSANDVDDFDGLSRNVRYRTGIGTDMIFTVKYSVVYVDMDGRRSATPTWIKEVTVRVTGPEGLMSPVETKQQLSPEWY